MLNVSRLLCARSLFFCLLLTAAGSTAEAQTTSINPALDRQLSRIDLGVLGVGVFNKNSNGFATVNGRANTAVNLNPSNTAGAVVTPSHTPAPFVGFDVNYLHSPNTHYLYPSFLPQ